MVVLWRLEVGVAWSGVAHARLCVHAQAIDCGHLANPGVQRLVIKRYDDCVIDVFGATSDADNLYAVAQYVRPPPTGISANCMRLQYDFVDSENS